MTISDDVSMFYNAQPCIFEKTEALRLNMIEAENLLCEQLKNNQLLGIKHIFPLGLIKNKT